MLLIISDMHFTDGTLGAGLNINPRAFEHLRDDIVSVIQPGVKPGEEKPDIKEVEILMLGDVFDLLRSAAWLDGGPMPWDDDEQRAALEPRITGVMRNIQAANSEAFEILSGLKTYIAKNTGAKQVTIRYVPGNHDRMVNWFESTRNLAAEMFGFERDGDSEYKWEYNSAEYEVVARYGDIYDGTNYDGSHDKSCVGDVVVICVVNRASQGLKNVVNGLKNISEPDRKKLLAEAEAIHYVCPMEALPAWIKHFTEEIESVAADADAPAQVAAVFDNIKKEFARALEAEERLSVFERISLRGILKIPSEDIIDFVQIFMENPVASRIFNHFSDNPFLKAAGKEGALIHSGGKINNVVYGHTHEPLQRPINVVGSKRQMYFNTGAWTKTMNIAPNTHKFIPWGIMAYAIFYKESENRGNRFEMWQGIRG